MMKKIFPIAPAKHKKSRLKKKHIIYAIIAAVSISGLLAYYYFFIFAFNLISFTFSLNKEDPTAWDGLPGLSDVKMKIEQSDNAKNIDKKFQYLEEAYITLNWVFWTEESKHVGKQVQQYAYSVLEKMKNIQKINPSLKINKYSIFYNSSISKDALEWQIAYLDCNLVDFTCENQPNKACFNHHIMCLTEKYNENLFNEIIKVIIKSIEKGASADDFEIDHGNFIEKANLLDIARKIGNQELIDYLTNTEFDKTIFERSKK